VIKNWFLSQVGEKERRRRKAKTAVKKNLPRRTPKTLRKTHQERKNPFEEKRENGTCHSGKKASLLDRGAEKGKIPEGKGVRTSQFRGLVRTQTPALAL